MGVAARFADLADLDAHALTFAGHEHEFIGFLHGESSDNFAGFLGHIHRRDPFAAAIGEKTVFDEGCAFAEAVFANDKHHGTFFVREAAHQEVVGIQGDTTHTGGVAADGAQIR